MNDKYWGKEGKKTIDWLLLSDELEPENTQTNVD